MSEQPELNEPQGFLQTLNSRREFIVSGIRTGVVLSVIAWMIARYDLFTFVVNLIYLIVIGALYGGITKKGGLGASNGAMIGLIYALTTLIFATVMLLPTADSFDVSRFFVTLITSIAVMAFLGMIVGIVLKKLFYHD